MKSRTTSERSNRVIADGEVRDTVLQRGVVPLDKSGVPEQDDAAQHPEQVESPRERDVKLVRPFGELCLKDKSASKEAEIFELTGESGSLLCLVALARAMLRMELVCERRRKFCLLQVLESS